MSIAGAAGGAAVVVIGAGPAGLTAAYELAKHDVRCTVLESEDFVGGIARTAEYKGYLFDMGGHRFFTKVSIIDKLWDDVMGSDMLLRPRSSRIYYRKKFFTYPLQPMNALLGLGVVESVRCFASYLQARLFPVRPEPDFETWVSNRFGSRLFDIFFRTYTEKVWGIPCRQIQAEWAAQRIKNLSLGSLLANALGLRKKRAVITTLIEEFKYPRRGPGMMWERVRDLLENFGTPVLLNTPVDKVYWKPGRVVAVGAGGRTFEVDHVLSSMPLGQLIESLQPAAPESIRAAARRLKYRDFLTVALIVRDRNQITDNWIYIHEQDVRVGRIQNYKVWSPEMVPDQTTTCLGMEYFCNEGDPLWSADDASLVEIARRELQQLRLTRPEDFIDGVVVRVKKAYPVYDETYQSALAEIREFLAEFSNLQVVGRNGMHRYNNQDHSMLTATLAARNVLGASFDVWRVNVDAEYHEAGDIVTEEELRAMHRTQPMVPASIKTACN